MTVVVAQIHALPLAAGVSLRALLVLPALRRRGNRLHALAGFACGPALAVLPTLATVLLVACQVHALLLAAPGLLEEFLAALLAPAPLRRP